MVVSTLIFWVETQGHSLEEINTKLGDLQAGVSGLERSQSISEKANRVILKERKQVIRLHVG
jgi:hypothetical protein